MRPGSVCGGSGLVWGGLGLVGGAWNYLRVVCNILKVVWVGLGRRACHPGSLVRVCNGLVIWGWFLNSLGSFRIVCGWFGGWFGVLRKVCEYKSLRALKPQGIQP